MRTKDGQAIKLPARQVAIIILAGVLLVATTGTVTYAALSATGRFGSHGKIVAIGLQVFDTSALTHEATDLDWGELAVGGSAALHIDSTVKCAAT